MIKKKEFKFFQFLRSGLRRMWLRFPERSKAIQAVRVPVKGLRHKWEVPCASCGGFFKMGEVDVDHKISAGSLTEWEHVDGFVRRLFCPYTDLQCLCKTCHKAKTKEERRKKS